MPKYIICGKKFTFFNGIISGAFVKIYNIFFTYLVLMNFGGGKIWQIQLLLLLWRINYGTAYWVVLGWVAKPWTEVLTVGGKGTGTDWAVGL